MDPQTRSASASRPLQGTAETPALQAPLTTPDDGSTRLPASVTLPRELVERILLLLDTKSMLTCKLVNREFNKIIQSSKPLQYFLACTVAGVIDNPQSPLSYFERLEALKKREDAWRKLKLVFEMTISVKHQRTSQIFRSTEGFFFLTDDNQKDLNYCHLTSFPQDNLRWTRIPGHGPALDWSGVLVEFATALYEHDLIVNLISCDFGYQADMPLYSLDLVLLKFSTGEYHPLAHRPRIHVQILPEVEPRVVVKIVGDNLALIVNTTMSIPDRLFIFDWKTGRKLLQHDAPKMAYSGLVFVSPELLLVPNLVLFHFEVWHLPPQQPNPKPPIQILSLGIPTLSPKYSLVHFDCYGEPNPFLHSPYLSTRPFFSSPENSIIIANLRLWTKSRFSVSYDFIMHRRALLDTIQTWTSPSLLQQQEYIPTWLTNEVTVHQVADPEDGSVQLEAQSKLVSARSSRRTRDSATFATSQTFPTSHISADSGSSSVSSGLSSNTSTSRCTFLQVPWEKWGPPISQVNESQAQRTAVSNGQRYAFLEPNPLDRKKLMVSVVDFNPHNLMKNAAIMARLRSGEGEDNGSNGNNEEGEGFKILDHKGLFSEEVHMGLKCVVYRAPGEYDFDDVFMDEERLFGVKLNHGGWKESIKVLYIG